MLCFARSDRIGSDHRDASIVFLFLLIALLTLNPGVSQASHWPDAVVEVHYGYGSGFGQDFFPENILGPPDSLATPSVPSADPGQILTLGTGGWIILSFQEFGIIDLPGPDFTVFENPFYFGPDSASFAETAIVSVSEDGANWTEFPYNPDTYESLAGVTPVDGSADPLDPSASGGDTFDLEDIGLSQIFYIKIADADTLVPDLGPSFDLDAVAALHPGMATRVDERFSPPSVSTLLIQAYPNPFNSELTVRITDPYPPYDMSLINSSGKTVVRVHSSSEMVTLAPENFASGSYFLVVCNSLKQSSVKKVVLLK